MEEEAGEEVRVTSMKKTQLPIAVSEDGGGAMSQGMQAASRRWKTRKQILP